MPVAEISRKKIAEAVLRVINAGKDVTENKLKHQDCIYAVDRARDEVIVEAFMQRKALDEHGMPLDYLTEKSVPLVNKSVYFEAQLPTRGLSLLSHNQGIFQVVLEEDPTTEVIPATNSHRTLFKNQPAAMMEGNPFYTPFQDTLRVYGVAKECNVLVQYVQASEYFTDDEFFCIPPSLQNIVVQRSIELLVNQRAQPEDPVTDTKG